VLHIEALEATYDGSPVLRGVDLDVPAGQLLCVLGPSGGGKSTLLRVVAGLEVPAAGRVKLDGRDLAGVPAHERGVGLMFQDYALFPHRNVAENVAFGLRMAGVDAAGARSRVAELLELVGLPGAERRPVSQLSGGEQQRVALARALAPRPRLLMLDEPMGSLDRTLRERLPEELRAIFTELGLTVIYVTHDQDEALSVADRVVLLASGRVVADDAPEGLWTRPANAWAARFLGFRNIAPAQVGDHGVETAWGRLPRSAVDGLEEVGTAIEGTLVIRPSALVTATDGPIRGRVSSRRFRGDHVLLVVETGAPRPLYVEAREGELPVPGDDIALRVLARGAWLMAGADEADPVEADPGAGPAGTDQPGGGPAGARS
jgi:thiamine transport system ATP-binding protein